MNPDQIALSSDFKVQATKSILAILLFIITYLIILGLSIVLAGFCVFWGLSLIVAYPGWLTLVVGLGLASFGVLILVFLLKFLFKSHKVERSQLHEVTAEDEPELFRLIDEIVMEVGTKFPKRVYLTPDVNAAVFYDSGFWSMFLPIKKNLMIGVGLVNGITSSELKAILGHEFGHFSQSTMKLGSYVYKLNQVIFNMLYDNESYDKIAQQWAEASGVFTIFVALAVSVVRGIQKVLAKLYEIMNKSYMGLSREMEFHADAIAASVTGYEPLKSSLLRMSLIEHSYTNILGYYEDKFKLALKSDNVYKEQSYVLNFVAEDNGLPVVNGLPEVSPEELNRFNKSKLNIKDQWASHPSMEERIEKLELTGRQVENLVNVPASSVFRDFEATQKLVTEKLFSVVEYPNDPTTVDFEVFKKDYNSEFQKNTFSKVYNGYYDFKNPEVFDLENDNKVVSDDGMDTLFSSEKIDLVYSTLALENDLEVLKQIISKSIPVKTFDYDGKKYNRKKAVALVSQLEIELKKNKEHVLKNDIAIFQFFYAQEMTSTSSSRLKDLYREYSSFDKVYDSKYEIFTTLSSKLEFINFVTPFDEIRSNFREISSHENTLKKEIQELMNTDQYSSEINEEIKDNFEKYLSKDWQYFGNEVYIENHLEILFKAMENYVYVLSKGYFVIKKQLLDYQESLIES